MTLSLISNNAGKKVLISNKGRLKSAGLGGAGSGYEQKEMNLFVISLLNIPNW